MSSIATSSSTAKGRSVFRVARLPLIFLTVIASVAVLLLYASQPRSAPRSSSLLASCQSASLHVRKGEGVVELYCAGTLRGKFLATFGQNPKGPKLREGDERTPEGHYQISSRVETPRFHRFMGVSYPNADDLRRAKELSITRPGGGIGVHGVDQKKAGLARLWLRAGHLLQLNRLWGPTDGCIGVSNEDVEVLYDSVRVGTPIEITP